MCHISHVQILYLVLLIAHLLLRRRTAIPTLRGSLLGRRHGAWALALLRLHVGSVPQILTKATYGASKISVFASKRYYGEKAESEPVPGLNTVRRPVSAVVTLRGDAFVALQRAGKVFGSHDEEECHGEIEM